MKIRGTQKEIKNIEIGIDTVYIRTNIIAIDEEEFKGWEYDEQQYGKDAYIEMMAEQNQSLDIQVSSGLAELRAELAIDIARL